MSTANDRSETFAIPVGPQDVKVVLPAGRHCKLPVIYRTFDHPLQLGSGQTYFFIHDGTFEGAESAYNLEVNELKIPQGSREEAIALGYMELFPGDIIFSRLASDPVSGANDVPVLWVTGGDIYNESLKAAALRARDCTLGLRSQRSRTHAVPDACNAKIKIGGTAWERALSGKFDEKRGRCYPFGCTFQRQRSLYSPCAAGKLSTTTSKALTMRKDLTNITLEMAMLSLKQGPPSVVEAIRLNHDLVNTPCIGTDSNFGFTSNQLNLAHVREWESSESLADNMGMKFGGAHIDQLDSPGHVTNMIALSDLPPGCDPGRFFVVYPGVFCTLDNFVSVNFSGLRTHGGSPPIAAQDATEYENTWATRCTIVSYAKTGPTTTEHKMPLMQLEPNAILSITPEMLRPEPFVLDKKSKVDATCFIVEGPSIMSPSSIVEFLARCFLMLVLTMISQLPTALNVKVDADAFLGSFYFTDQAGVPHRVKPWSDGPGWRNGSDEANTGDTSHVEETFGNLEEQTDHLNEKRRAWTQHRDRFGAHIPSVVCCVADIAPLEGWSAGDPLRKIKPLLFRKAKDRESSGNDSDDEDPSTKVPEQAQHNGVNSEHQSSSSKGTGSDAPLTTLSLSNAHPPAPMENVLEAESLRSPQRLHSGNSGALRDLPLRLDGGSVNLGDSANISPSSPPFPFPEFGNPQDWPRPLSPASDDRVSLSVLFPHAEHAIQTPVLPNSNPSCTLGKRTRLDIFPGISASGVLVEHHNVELREENHSSKHRATVSKDTMDQIWHNESYQKLEIHLTNCPTTVSNFQGGDQSQESTDNIGSTKVSAARLEINDLRDLPKYLQRITTERVRNEVDRLHDDVVSLATHQQTFDLAETVDNLTSFHSYLSTEPLGDDSFAAVQNVFAALDALEQIEMLNAIRLRKLRACIMLSSAAAWNWLLVDVPSAISEIVHGDSPLGESRIWLTSLMMDVHGCITDGAGVVKFVPSKYGLTLCHSLAVHIDTTRYNMPDDGDNDAWIRLYTCVISAIIEVWLGYPSAGKLKWQGIYALNIVQTLGREFLYLDLVWQAYCSVTAKTVQVTALPEHLDRSAYPLLNPSSQLRRYVNHVWQLVEDCMAGNLYVPDISQPLASLSYASESLMLITEQRAQCFRRFVLDCFRHIILEKQLSNRKLQKLLNDNPDKYSLFRERAPTRANMLKDDGPFSPKWLRTVSGLFSAIVARGVTFGTTFSREGRTVFTCHEDFEQALDECPKVLKISDYCDQRAYGRTNHKRNAGLALTYWNKLHEYIWPGLYSVKPWSFEETYKYFFSNGSSRFTEIGQLTSYLITVDYVYAGLTVAPDVETLGKLVYRLNKGPLHALEYMGIVAKTADSDSDQKPTQAERDLQEKQVQQGFIIMDRLIKETIPAEYHQHASVDVFLTEHALCKFARIHRLCNLTAD